jgi:hypothetical protein
MKLSSLPANVKLVLFGRPFEDWDDDDLAEMTTDELIFIYFYGFFFHVMVALHERSVDMRDLDRRGNPWGSEKIELDEPLPPRRRDPRWPADCAGEREYLVRKHHSPTDDDGDLSAEHYRSEVLSARYEDLFAGHKRYGWPAPDSETWAKTQDVPGLPPRGRKRDERGRFVAS